MSRSRNAKKGKGNNSVRSTQQPNNPTTQQPAKKDFSEILASQLMSTLKAVIGRMNAGGSFPYPVRFYRDFFPDPKNVNNTNLCIAVHPDTLDESIEFPIDLIRRIETNFKKPCAKFLNDNNIDKKYKIVILIDKNKIKECFGSARPGCEFKIPSALITKFSNNICNIDMVKNKGKDVLLKDIQDQPLESRERFEKALTIFKAIIKSILITNFLDDIGNKIPPDLDAFLTSQAFIRPRDSINADCVILSELYRVKNRLFVKRFKAHVPQNSLTEIDETDLLTFYPKTFIDDIYSKPMSTIQRAKLFSLILTLVMDFYDDLQAMQTKVESFLFKLEKLNELKDLISQALFGISPEEELKIFSTQYLSLNFGFMERAIATWFNEIKELESKINTNISFCLKAIPVFEEVYEFQDFYGFDSDSDSNEENYVEDSDEDLPDLIPANSSLIASSLFAPEENVTLEQKKLAQARIDKMEQRANQHANRAPRQEVCQQDIPKAHVNQSELCTVSYSYANQKPVTGFARQLNRTANLYLMVTGDHKFEDFYSTMRDPKILKHDSKGANGLKFYGDFLAVKCLSQQGNRLICILHPIEIDGAKKHVYIPVEVVTHKAYESYLNDKRAMDQFIEKAQRSTVVKHIGSTAENGMDSKDQNAPQRKFAR